jgi:hypothetical protein
MHDFLEMSFALSPIGILHVNPQLDAKLEYDRDVFHGYVD